MTIASTGAPWRARLLRGTLTSVLALGLAVGVSPLSPAAEAAERVKHHEGRKVEQMTLKRLPSPSRGAKVMAAVRRQAGDPYVWGGSGPNRFDCSGLTQYVYRTAAGEQLPHSSSGQVGRTKRISRAAARPGDLVFFHNGGGVYHVAIFAGGNQIWHAPGSGQRVTRAAIWTSSHFFGRVR
ncbi:C40 family peptidase [Nocardioides dongkuii]|uniref:C40 family peptidase n=1 Tax=Nocardioides dongkuii TaxID=2760089 RepID=UPI00187889FD|nr:C40 family peptidase [Nocardioides dongkuii]